MRTRTFGLSALAAVLLAGSPVFAATVMSSDLLGQGSFEWFRYNPVTLLADDWAEANVSIANSPYITGIENELTEAEAAALNLRRYEDGPGVVRHTGTGDTTTPGIGGQNFDIEQAFYGYRGNQNGGILYIGIVTGFDPTGVLHSDNNWYYAGDFFLNLGSTNAGPGTSYSTLALGTSWASAGGDLARANRTTGLAYDLTQAHTLQSVNVTQHRAVADPYRVNTGVAYTGAYDVNWIVDVLGNGSDHNLLEIAVALNSTQATLLANGGFGAHWTMLCGNDILPISGTPPVVPVPAAAPMILLGMGGIAFMRRVRKPKA